MASLPVHTITNKKKPYAFYLFFAWTIFIVFSLLLTIHNLQKAVLEQAAIEARTHLELNLEYRALISELGGVYASVDAISPNPYLVAPKRDITTKDGDKLTLLNPAYMTRLIFEKIKNKSSLPVINKITSLKVVNPINAPDEWERKTLLAFDKGGKEAREITSINGNSYLRLMRPFFTESSCLKCHGYQGYEEGEVRGAISIAVPLKPYNELAMQTRNISIITYLLLWLIGCIGLIFFSKSKHKQEQRLVESEWKFRTVSESANDWEYWLSENRQIVYMSPSSEKITGYGAQEFINNPDLLTNIIHPEDRPLFLNHIENLQDESHEEMEFRIVSKSGQIKWLAHICAPLYMQHKFLGRRISNRDITYHKMAEEALHESYEQIEDLYNNAPCGYHSLDRDGRFIRINDTELQWLGYNRDEVIDKMKFFDVITVDSLRTFEKNFPIFKAQGWIRDLEFEMVRKDGTILPVLLSASAIKDNNGNYVMSRSTVYDITKRKQAEEELRKYHEHLEEIVEQRTAELKKMTDELTRSNKDLKEFAYVVSHDLREPLQVIKGFLALFEKRYKDKLDEKAIELIRFAVDGAKRMQELIKDLLEYSQVGTRGKEFKPADCSLILNKAISNLKVSIEESGAVVTHDGLPTVIADAIQLSSLFQNLIGNAIKFRGSEAPRIHISAQRKGDEWLFSVGDNGIGIDPEFADKIFDVFQRLHSTEEYPGTGIGLAICKKIVEHHEGRIWVESEPGEGATFYFTIPKDRQRP
jgi:PAS domain S-box-containing protein